MKSDRLNVQQIQLEQLAAIGAALRQAREEQGLSVEQVATKTLIQRRLLEAIETADFQELPEIIYVRGFIKRYADELGLEGEQISELLPSEPTVPGLKPSWKELPAAQLRPLHLYVLYILLIGAAVSGLSYLLRQNAAEVVVAPSPTAPATVEPKVEASNTASPSSVAASAPAASPTARATDNQPIQVEITLTSQSWMRVVIDGDTAFEGILQEGDKRTWTAEKQLTIRAGNAGGVMVAFNNQDAKQLGAPGAVEEVTFPDAQSTAQLLPSVANALPPDSNNAQD